MQIDTSSPIGRRALERLGNDPLVWLTTVSADGTPQPSPVWFVWAGDSILMYSQANMPKLRHIRANPNVALHFDSNGQGGDIVIVTGQARVVDDVPPANANSSYIDKYAEMITQIGMNPDSFAASYSVPVRITPARLRGHD